MQMPGVSASALSLAVPPEEEPVSVTEVKAFLGLEGEGADALIAGQIRAARRMVEGWTGQALLEQSWDLVLDAFPDTVTLPLGPALWVARIGYVDPEGAARVLPVGTYQVDLLSPAARIRPAPGHDWPATRRQMNAVTIRIVVGYSDLPEEVPEDLAAAVKLTAALLVGRAGPAAADGAGLRSLVQALLAPHCAGRPGLAPAQGAR